jgi:hypothetical protein
MRSSLLGSIGNTDNKRSLLYSFSNALSTKSTGDRFNQFLENIKLTSYQINDARTKYDGVCKKLHDHFYSYNYSGSTKFLTGSYGKNTNVRPARDVDVFFKMPWDKFQSNSLSNVQSSLLQRVRNILMEKYSNTTVRADRNVVVVNFSNSHFVELIPAFEVTLDEANKGKFYIPDSSGYGSWKLVNPRAEINYINESDKSTGGNTKNLIRILKKWQENCNVPIKSLVIELRVVNFLKSYEYAKKSTVYYDWMVRDFFKKLLDFVNGQCEMPGSNEKIYYGSLWQSKAESAYNRAKKACEYESKKEYTSATQEWKKIFGNEFYF